VRLTKGGFSLPGQTVNVATTQGSLNSASGITDSNGEAFFILRSRYGFQPTRPTNSSPGTAAITATATVLLPAGSRFVDQQDPDSRQRLVLGQNTQVTAQALGTRTWVQTDNVIIAHKFEDRNFSGVQEEDEPDLAGWQFTLTVAAGAAPVQYTANSDSSGNVYFYSRITGNGTYTVTEALPDGWIGSTPLSQSRTRTDQDLWNQWHANFGNARYSIIEVSKFLDLNGDGVWDNAGEPALPGWQFALYKWLGTDWAQHRGGTTGPDGRVVFTDLAGGQYKIVERLESRPGYVNTTPLEQIVSLGYPDRMAVTFGNRGALSISGAKWHDLDGDGVWDAGEPGLPGWTIQLNGGPRGANWITTTTAGGSYAFANLEPGTYTVTESLQVGWSRSAPAGGGYTVVSTGSTQGP
jgi:hypothetical protein